MGQTRHELMQLNFSVSIRKRSMRIGDVVVSGVPDLYFWTGIPENSVATVAVTEVIYFMLVIDLSDIVQEPYTCKKTKPAFLAFGTVYRYPLNIMGKRLYPKQDPPPP